MSEIPSMIKQMFEQLKFNGHAIQSEPKNKFILFWAEIEAGGGSRIDYFKQYCSNSLLNYSNLFSYLKPFCVFL